MTASAESNRVCLVCSEVWGGIQKVRLPVEIPGMRGLICAHPSGAERGGDVYYLTACSSGMMARICLADVAGHGDEVAAFSGWLHDSLRQHMNVADPERVLSAVNRAVNARGVEVMSTAAFFAYHATDGRLRYGYAGHPHALLMRAGDRAWRPLAPPIAKDRQPRNMTFGVLDDVTYDLGTVVLNPGDRFIVYSDGVTEAMSGANELFGDERLAAILNDRADADCVGLGECILEALRSHTGKTEPSQDDVTFMIFEAVDQMKGLKPYVFLKNRVRKAIGRA